VHETRDERVQINFKDEGSHDRELLEQDPECLSSYYVCVVVVEVVGVGGWCGWW
jgi:hypothetical protein